MYLKLVDTVGLKPTTNALKGRCSIIELHIRKLKRSMLILFSLQFTETTLLKMDTNSEFPSALPVHTLYEFSF